MENSESNKVLIDCFHVKGQTTTHFSTEYLNFIITFADWFFIHTSDKWLNKLWFDLMHLPCYHSGLAESLVIWRHHFTVVFVLPEWAATLMSWGWEKSGHFIIGNFRSWSSLLSGSTTKSLGEATLGPLRRMAKTLI